MTRRHLMFGSTGLAVTSGGAAEKAESLVWSPLEIQWQREERGGAKYAVLEGDRDRAGSLFTYAFQMPSGLWVGGHHHTQDAHVVVVRGTLLLGWGRRMRKDAVRRIGAGGFFVVRAGVEHFEGCEGETLIIGTSVGPWKTTELE
ncbi:MAG: cupin domain-containing protein [Bryobacteraceae bacterium]|nr:cupin domain-containing protein [Bryobacteraceae bacterium]